MLYWRLSGYYLFYFATLGALVPYWGLYLKSLGFSAHEIGELMAWLMAARIVSPNLWGWVSDHLGRRMAIVRLTTLLTVLSFAGVFFGSSYGWLALVMALFSFFWSASLPQFEANTLTHLGDKAHRYSTIRLWGSIGFILAVVILGVLLDRLGINLLPNVMICLMTGIWLMSLRVPEGIVRQAHHAYEEPLRKVVWRPEVLAFLLMCFLMAASHGPYYTFYSIYLQDHGYSASLIGPMWALGVLAEIVIFLMMSRLLANLGLRLILLLSLALATLRWLLIGLFINELSVLIFAQFLHAVSFGSYHAAAIHLVHSYFIGRHQGRGQALYSSLGFGAGGAAGSLYSGYLWESVGPTLTFSVAALASTVAFLVVLFLMRARV